VTRFAIIVFWRGVRRSGMPFPGMGLARTVSGGVSVPSGVEAVRVIGEAVPESVERVEISDGVAVRSQLLGE